jgi:hypothetical protein
VRIASFVVVLALTGVLTFTASGKQRVPEPSESQMASSFGRFLSRLEKRPVSDIEFTAFRKTGCKPIDAAGHNCIFSYSARLPAGQFSILRERGTISGSFIADEKGGLRFETVVG